MVQFPTQDEVRHIASIEDPVIRNLRITQCYHELSGVLTRWTGLTANWCTFATWASRQAGQTIRKEDLGRLLISHLRNRLNTYQSLGSSDELTSFGLGDQSESFEELELDERNFTPAIVRASDAAARGNKKVFEEIGLEFARFFATCLREEMGEPEEVELFCEGLRPGDPPEGQRYLRQAFTHYSQAILESDEKTREELILLANIEIGLHEQTRLQPEIAESLDAGLASSFQLTRKLISSIFPFGSWLALTNFYVRKLLGRPTRLDLAVLAMLTHAQILLRQTITEVMMVISLPSGVQLKLGEDLVSGYPEILTQLTNPELRSLLETIDPTPDSPVDSGAIDWADLSDRLHFIVELFRSFQESGDLFTPPYNPEQVESMRAGRLPPGRL